MSKQTPLFEKHKDLNAKIVDFSGFEMPIQYKGIREEHMAVRERAGLFDVSHMGEFFISGPEALDLIQHVTINDASRLRPGKAQYSAMCYENGGIVDDLLVYCFDENSYMLVVNAANIDKDREWIHSHNNFDAKLDDRSETTALLAIQGPSSIDILSKIVDEDPSGIGFYNFEQGKVAGQKEVIISATGYTGEKGFELYIDTRLSDPVQIWDALMDAGKGAGLEPAGLGARDTLRLEMGLALYGNDITEKTTPLEGRLGWLTKLDKGPFIGSEALKKQKEKGVERRLTGFIVQESRLIPRKDYPICDSGGDRIGIVTSGTQSIVLGKGIGMGYVPAETAAEGEQIQISIRKKMVSAITKKPPFIDK